MLASKDIDLKRLFFTYTLQKYTVYHVYQYYTMKNGEKKNSWESFKKKEIILLYIKITTK
jgi:hypothetical protein